MPSKVPDTAIVCHITHQITASWSFRGGSRMARCEESSGNSAYTNLSVSVTTGKYAKNLLVTRPNAYGCFVYPLDEGRYF